MNVGLFLNEAEYEALMQIAADLDCMSTRGPKAGTPSIRAILRDIASGDIVCKRVNEPEALLVDKINKLREKYPDMSQAEIMERVGCSRSLVSYVFSGDRGIREEVEVG